MARTASQRVFGIFNIVFLGILAFVCLYPYINILAISFNDGKDAVLGGITFFPRKFTLINYSVVFNSNNIFGSLAFSCLRTLVGTVLTLLCTAMGAYVFTKKDLLFKNGIITYFLIPMFLNGGLIPYFLVVKSLGLMNNFFVYILPVIFDFYSAIIMRVYFQANIPESLSESAYLDGATDFAIFFRVYLPLSKPMLAAIALFIGVAAWNDWFTTMLFCNQNQSLWTLQYLLQRLVMETQNAMNMALKMSHSSGKYNIQNLVTPQTITYATLVVATVPILIVYPFLQKYFVSGMMLGSIKG